MINYTDLQTFLYNLFTDITGIQIIWADPNAPRPNTPYITLKFISLDTVGQDYITKPDHEGMSSLFGNRELTLEINYFGQNGLDTMEKIRTAFFNPSIREQLNGAGLAFVERLAFLDTTQLLDTKHERRYTMELRFRYSNQGVSEPDKIDIGFIETAEVKAQILGQSGGIISEDTFTVSEE